MRRTLRLAAPLIGAQLLQIGNSLVDTMVAGQLGRVELAAVGIGSSLWFIVYLTSIGLLAGLSPTMARYIGQGRSRDVGVVFRQGIWLAAILGCLDLVFFGILSRAICGWGFEGALVDEMRNYLDPAKWGILPAVLLLSARNVCEATGRTRPVLIVQAIGLLVNLIADLGFGLGWFGLPKLGLAGIGWSTTIVMTVNCCVLFLLIRGDSFRRFRLSDGFDWPDLSQLRSLLILSAPICLSMVFEAGLFTATAIQMGKLGTLASSAHNIAIGATAFFYMLPLGLGFALTARVGMAFGREQMHSIRLRVTCGVLTTIAMAIGSAVVLLLFRHQIASVYTRDPAVQMLAAQLLVLAAVFQISDDLQATLLAMLRGLHDTRVPMLINAFAYWVIAFGIGYFTAHHLNFGAFGLWLGLIVGLSLSASLLGWRLAWRIKYQGRLFEKQA